MRPRTQKGKAKDDLVPGFNLRLCWRGSRLGLDRLAPHRSALDFRHRLRRFGLRLGFGCIHSVPLSEAGGAIFHMENPVRILVNPSIMGDDQDAAALLEDFFLHESDNRSPVSPSSEAVVRRELESPGCSRSPRNGDPLLLTAREFDWEDVVRFFSPTTSRHFLPRRLIRPMALFKISGMRHSRLW